MRQSARNGWAHRAAILATLLYFAASSSGVQAQTPAGAEPPAFTAAWDGQADGAAQWTQWLREGLETGEAPLIDFIPADATAFCDTWPALARRDREQVWITLITAIAERESDFDPHASFDEPLPLGERSIGLMQLSLSDAREFHCGFSTETEIEDPHLNLACALRILVELVRRDGVIGGGGEDAQVGAAAYWSVLNVRGHADARALIVAQTRALPACRRRSRPSPIKR